MLDTRLRKCGLAVIAFPSNDFGNQEPNSNADIKEFDKKASTPPSFSRAFVSRRSDKGVSASEPSGSVGNA